MSKKTTKKKQSTKKPAKNAALESAISELLVAVGTHPTEDKAGLVRQLAARVDMKPSGRKREISIDNATKTFEKMLEAKQAPDVSAVFTEELTELIRMQDMWLDDENIQLKLSSSIKIADTTVSHVTVNNLRTIDFIELDAEPYELLSKGGDLKEIGRIVSKILRCTEDEAFELAPRDINRIWGVFGCFFLGR